MRSETPGGKRGFNPSTSPEEKEEPLGITLPKLRAGSVPSPHTEFCMFYTESGSGLVPGPVIHSSVRKGSKISLVPPLALLKRSSQTTKEHA
jgi:hypothetical protein